MKRPYTHPLDSAIVAAACVVGAVLVVAWAVGRYVGAW